MMHHDASHASCQSQAGATPPLRTCAISLFLETVGTKPLPFTENRPKTGRR